MSSTWVERVPATNTFYITKQNDSMSRGTHLCACVHVDRVRVRARCVRVRAREAACEQLESGWHWVGEELGGHEAARVLKVLRE